MHTLPSQPVSPPPPSVRGGCHRRWHPKLCRRQSCSKMPPHPDFCGGAVDLRAEWWRALKQRDPTHLCEAQMHPWSFGALAQVVSNAEPRMAMALTLHICAGSGMAPASPGAWGPALKCAMTS